MDAAERPASRATTSGTQVSRPNGRKRADTKRDRIVRSAAKLFLDSA